MKKPIDETEIVVTVPANFNELQRRAIKKAAEMVGMKICLVNAPTAAAVAYGVMNEFKKDIHIVVYDFGGGTFDATLLNIDDGDITVIGTDGEKRLGGQDLT